VCKQPWTVSWPPYPELPHHRSLTPLFSRTDTLPNHLQAWSSDKGRCHRDNSSHLCLGSHHRYVKKFLLANGSFIWSQPHKYGTYGIAPNNLSSDDENDPEDTLPRSALNAPIEALQGLANAAVEAANTPEIPPRYVGISVPSTSRLVQPQQGTQEEKG